MIYVSGDKLLAFPYGTKLAANFIQTPDLSIPFTWVYSIEGKGLVTNYMGPIEIYCTDDMESEWGI